MTQDQINREAMRVAWEQMQVDTLFACLEPEDESGPPTLADDQFLTRWLLDPELARDEDHWQDEEDERDQWQTAGRAS